MFVEFQRVIAFRIGRFILIFASLQTLYRIVLRLLLLQPFNLFITDWTALTVPSASRTSSNPCCNAKLNLWAAHGSCKMIGTGLNALKAFEVVSWVDALQYSREISYLLPVRARVIDIKRLASKWSAVKCLLFQITPSVYILVDYSQKTYSRSWTPAIVLNREKSAILVSVSFVVSIFEFKLAGKKQWRHLLFRLFRDFFIHPLNVNMHCCIIQTQWIFPTILSCYEMI
jgi:hypothetical protein